MKSGAIILGGIVSLALLAIAGVLYVMASSSSDQHYRRSIDLVREAQQVSSEWSMEVTRVRADPFADFDSLAAFIPRMERIKRSLTTTVQLVPDFPDRLANDLQAYLSAFDAKEERIERFKTGYAVIRNSTRYLPLAATNAVQQAQEADEQQAAQRISALVRDINLYLPTPTETAQARLTADIEGLREASVAYPPTLANAIANLLSHAEVLVARQRPTDDLFQKITSDQISDLTDQLAGKLKFELDKEAVLMGYFDGGVLAALVLLVVFWLVLGIHQRARGGGIAQGQALPAAAPAAQAAPVVQAAPVAQAAAVTEKAPTLVEAAAPTAEPAPAMAEIPMPSATVDQVARATVVPEARPPSPAEASPPAASEHSGSALVQGFLVRCVADALATTADQIGGRMDYLRQSHRRIQEALQNSDAVPDLHDAADLDEGAEAIAAIATSVDEDVAGMADLGKRLASFSNSNVLLDDIERRMIDINGCVEEALDATGAESVATVAKNLGDIPELLALKPEFLLLLTKIVENSVQAVEELSERRGVIKVDTAHRNNEVLITIIDNGDGITPERRTNIFKPFYTSRKGAMGIGLTLAGHLVKKYEGSIKLNSLPGQGTVARITLPAGIPSP